MKTKKHHIPVVDRTPLEPPPVVVAVVGPPKVGKSTLIKCLIKNFTRQKLVEIRGPVTIVSGKCGGSGVCRVAFIAILISDIKANNNLETSYGLSNGASLCLS